MIRYQERLEGMKAEEMGGCGSMGDGRVWEQWRWQGMGAGEMGGCVSRGDGRCRSNKDGRLW